MIKAFTLMELMIVVVLIGILSTIGIIFFGDTQDDAKKKVAEVSTSSIYLAQQEYNSKKILDDIFKFFDNWLFFNAIC